MNIFRMLQMAMLVLVLVLLLGGCADGEPTIDATNEGTILESLESMADANSQSYSLDELLRAASIVGHDALKNADRSTLEDWQQQDQKALKKRLDGMTSRELMEEMERIQNNNH